MSLHLGNLSSRIRRDELERVFRRFGQCTVQVKDKFGFVIYEYPANAEKALRTLRGKKICGEKITLSWSNRQPRPLQRNAGVGRTYEPPRGRYYARDDYANRKLGLDVRDGNRKGFRQVDRSAKLDSADLIHEAEGRQLNNVEDYVADKRHDFVHDLSDEGGGIAANFLENDRWGEQVIANEVETELDFDRYEPYQADDRKEQENIHTSSHLDGSSRARKSQEKPEMEQVDQQTMELLHNSKCQHSCYACGEVGHKMHRCPRELKRLPTRYRGLLDLDRDAASTGRHKSDIETSTSKNHRSLQGHGDSPVARLANRVGEKEYQENKRSRKEDATPERHHSKKARVPVSSSIHSDYTASRSPSQSRSQRCLSGSHSHSRSKLVPCRKNSLCSKSRSGSTSSRPRSKDFNFQSVSRSSSPTSLCLSLSLGQPLPSSPNKVQIYEKGSLVNVSNPEFKETSVEVDPFVKADAGEDKAKLEMVKLGVENGSSAAPVKADEDLPDNHTQSRDDVDNHSFSREICELKKSCIPQSDSGDHSAGNISPMSVRGTSEVKSDDFVREDNLITVKNLGMEALVRHHAANLMNISSNEIFMLLKNYGLDHQNDNHLPPESYFGSARLWPWEIIYYRRLKKGPISKDNYARRLAQNEEFGIGDKYVRSSSGWTELTDENP